MTRIARRAGSDAGAAIAAAARPGRFVRPGIDAAAGLGPGCAACVAAAACLVAEAAATDSRRDAGARPFRGAAAGARGRPPDLGFLLDSLGLLGAALPRSLAMTRRTARHDQQTTSTSEPKSAASPMDQPTGLPASCTYAVRPLVESHR